MPDGKTKSEKTTLNQKILGVRVRQARLRTGLSLNEVAQALGVSTEVVSKIEAGDHAVTLPQLEVVALICNMPVLNFWSDLPTEDKRRYPTVDAIAFRQRIIGLLLRKVRTEAGRSEEDLAKQLAIPASQITQYELGQVEIPVIQLEALAHYFNVPINYFLDNSLALSDANLSQKWTPLEEIIQFSQFPPDVREFLANPANLLYINIAMRLGELSVDTLRGLAEGLLEVTY
jgi:transcriptional regulator with XRE-family HTH domain